MLPYRWIDGIGFEQVTDAPCVTRDHVGEIVVRFFHGSLYRFGQFSGNPHPGNFLLLRDGRVPFLDFGMTKAVPRQRIEAELGVLRAALEHDPDAVHGGWPHSDSLSHTIHALIASASWITSAP